MNKKSTWKRGLLVLALLAILAGGFNGASLAANPSASKPPVVLGVHVVDWLNQDTLDQEVIAVDNWTGKKSSLVSLLGYFNEEPTNFTTQLDLLWNNGYTPFLNLEINNTSAAQIAAGQVDDAIIAWAEAIDGWASGEKWLYIAPLPEMNTTWVSYGQDPENYKVAFARIVQIFGQHGVPDAAVQWVFAPNGWAHLVFEPYYPGDGIVDVVGVSAYNWGYCSDYNVLWYWNPPSTTFGFYIKKLNQMAPDKPVFITQAATTAVTANGSDTNAKNQWLQEAYDYLAIQYGVQAVIYYNYSPAWQCDWRMFEDGSFAYEGYKWGVSNPAFGYLSPSQLKQTDLTPTLSGDIFAPLINKGSTGSGDKIMLGMYTQNWTGLQKVMVDEVQGLNNWSGKHVSIVGTFVDFTSNATDEIELQLEVIWENGYVPFLNLATFNSYFTAARIANGEADSYLHDVARAYAMFAKGGKQYAYVAPLYEMNAVWPPYGGDPANYILAYKRIQQIFDQEGVPEQSVAWVWAPNGNSAPGVPDFEYFYPGDAYVEYLGFTAYHFGYCDAMDPSYQGWLTPQVAIGTYLTKLTALAPDKQIILAQTGTTAMTKGGLDHNAKNSWLVDMYNYLAGFDQLHAVLYYNRWDSDCDWAVYNPTGTQYVGYMYGVANPAYGYFTQYQQLRFFTP